MNDNENFDVMGVLLTVIGKASGMTTNARMGMVEKFTMIATAIMLNFGDELSTHPDDIHDPAHKLLHAIAQICLKAFEDELGMAAPEQAKLISVLGVPSFIVNSGILAITDAARAHILEAEQFASDDSTDVPSAFKGFIQNLDMD